MKKRIWMITFAIVLMFAMMGSVFAFNDIQQYSEKNIANDLQKRGIFNGINDTEFAPDRPLTYAQAVSLYVRTFNLSLAHITFVKAPDIKDYYSNIPANAWYSDAFIIAYHNGIELPRDVNPDLPISREEFAYYLEKGILTTGDYMLIDLWNVYEDQDVVDPSYQSAINTLLIMGVVDLDNQRMFKPKQKITRMEAATWIYNALQFIENNERQFTLPVEEKIDVYTETVSEGVVKVTVDWGEQPNPGYGVRIDRIEFVGDEAIIYYSLHYPDPELFYPQVMVHAKASTYIDAKYKVKTVQNYYYSIDPSEDSQSISNPAIDKSTAK